jgi:hypothetical protein
MQDMQLFNDTDLGWVNEFADPTNDLALVSLDYACIEAGIFHLDLLLGPAACSPC